MADTVKISPTQTHNWHVIKLGTHWVDQAVDFMEKQAENHGYHDSCHLNILYNIQ
jgi:hypothetical protein